MLYVLLAKYKLPLIISQLAISVNLNPITPLIPMETPGDVVHTTAISQKNKRTVEPRRKGERARQGKLAKESYDASDYKEK